MPEKPTQPGIERLQKESTKEQLVLAGLHSAFGNEEFSLKDLAGLHLPAAGGKGMQTIIFDLCDAGHLSFKTKNGIRYFKINETKNE